ncbi:ABC transporter substrate-binding protein [Paenibacillus aurantiacus]|uniref:ABC transporter substrate-binding protein n=1 Tax=Paenibacillus aurantiacus TaxID=1936118 RepID=A0ABV5KMX0_9BACL
MNNRQKRRVMLALMTLLLVLAAALSGCSGGNGNNGANAGNGTTEGSANGSANQAADDEADNAEPVKLKLAMWDTKTDLDFWTEKVKAYTAIKPNVTVEVEKVPDNSGQYLKVRLAAGDLPDLFFLKQNHFQIYKDALLPLDELDAAKNNKYPTKIDGKVLGVPLVSFAEFVYYHPSIFEELNLAVPQTMPEFMALMEKIKANGKYTPLSIGGKDNWTFYPLTEFGPHVLSGDTGYLAKIAKEKAPFAAGSTFDTIAKIVKEIADKKYAGPDALSISFDQSTQQFEAKKAAMIALGQWYYASYMEKVKADDDLAVFPLPFRNATSEKLTSLTMSDMNVGINKKSESVEEAKAFLDWMFSPEVYPEYITKVQQFSTVNGIESDLPFFNKWTAANPYEPFVYDGTDAGYAKVSSAAQYDPKLAAQEIFAGKRIDKVESDLNNKWAKAVEANP